MVNIWVICSENVGDPKGYVFKLLSKAQDLISRNINISAICFGKFKYSTLENMFFYGANKVIHIPFAEITCSQVAKILSDMVMESRSAPELIMFSATEWSKNTAAELSIKIGAGLTAECIDIEYRSVNGKYQFIFTRAALNSSVLVKIVSSNTNICMCTCKERSFFYKKNQNPNSFLIYQWDGEINKPNRHYTVLQSRSNLYQRNHTLLKNANIVFGLGRGVRKKSDLELVKKIANKYNAVIAGSRGLVEKGFIEPECQIGQSGISIAPDIYVAIGISGSSQHIAGVKNTKKIIAINSDPDAPIFSYADYCIIDDFREVFMELL